MTESTASDTNVSLLAGSLWRSLLQLLFLGIFSQILYYLENLLF